MPLQFQLIEAEQLPFYLARPTPNTPQGNVVRASIEFDPSGRRTAYYFYKQHPGERIFFPTDLRQSLPGPIKARHVSGRENQEAIQVSH